MIPIHDTPSTKRFPLITVLLVLSCVYIFYLQLQDWPSLWILSQYALIPSHIDISNPISLSGFVTAIFLHGGIMHIISNMLFLWVFGNNVENHIGGLTYLILYLVGGVLGNVAQFLIDPTSTIPIIGASGAIATVLGAYFVFFPRNTVLTVIPILVFPLFFRVPARILLILWFFLQLFSSLGSPVMEAGGGIAYTAHVIGFIVGLLYAAVYTRTVQSNTT